MTRGDIEQNCSRTVVIVVMTASRIPEESNEW